MWQKCSRGDQLVPSPSLAKTDAAPLTLTLTVKVLRGAFSNSPFL